MTEKFYPIAEVYPSIQGEGRWSGRKAIFLRFGGCNLNCSWCDTEKVAGRNLTLNQVLCDVDSVNSSKCHFLVITGGEPLLFLDNDLLRELRSRFDRICIETNGTQPLPEYVHENPLSVWVSWSPKDPSKFRETSLEWVDEIKVVIPGGTMQIGDNRDGCGGWSVDDLNALADWSVMTFGAVDLTLQPMTILGDVSNVGISEMVSQVFRDQRWKASVQVHKILGLK
jgi:organic radical activating enzyme